MFVNKSAVFALALSVGVAMAWTPPRPPLSALGRVTSTSRERCSLSATDEHNDGGEIPNVEFESEEQKKEVVGNLVADDEWDGLTMELTDLVRKAGA